QHPAGMPLDLATFRHAAWSFACNFVVYLPWLGPEGTEWLSRHTSAFFFTLWAAVIAISAGFLARRNHGQLLLAWACVILIAPLTWIVRPGSAHDVSNLRLGAEWLISRYALSVAAASCVGWLALLRPDFRNISVRELVAGWFVIAGGCISLISVPTLHSFAAKGVIWSDQAAVLQSSWKTGQPPRVEIPIAPDGWVMVYDAPSRN
ncbi:MAG: hypothetical protein ACJ790_19190, partial [Myxococcaceae bacterium]